MHCIPRGAHHVPCNPLKPGIPAGKACLPAGAAATGAQLALFREKLPENHFLASYGLSEMAPVTITEYEDTGEHITATVGKPMEHIEMKIVSVSDGHECACGETGEILIQLLESRLDNIVYRLGIAPTRAAARQLVSHRHILVNGDICNIPSTLLVPGDTVEVRERSKVLEVIVNSLNGKTNQYSWLEWDGGLMTGKFMNYPEREEIPETINEQAIVELYSK